MRKFIVCAAFVLALILPGAATAEPPGGGGYGWMPGAATAAEVGAQCGTGASSGSFGAFGTYGDVTHDFGINNLGSNGEPGANGYQTGLNNSGVCGNRP